MTIKLHLVRGLLRLYPSIWCDEYGEELEALLLLRALTPFVIGDVLLNAARQHLRRDQPWKIWGLFLVAWSLFWITWNSVAPLSPISYQLFNRTERYVLPLIYFATGYWTAVRGGCTVSPSAWAAVKAALAGIAPELTLLILNTIGILPQVLVDVNGDPRPRGGGIALLHTRGPISGALWGIQGEIVLMPVLIAVLARFFGLLGALLGREVLKLRMRPMPAKRQP